MARAEFLTGKVVIRTAPNSKGDTRFMNEPIELCGVTSFPQLKIRYINNRFRGNNIDYLDPVWFDDNWEVYDIFNNCIKKEG